MSRGDAREKHQSIQAQVDAAPPLTPAQRARLAAILAASRRRKHQLGPRPG